MNNVNEHQEPYLKFMIANIDNHSAGLITAYKGILTHEENLKRSRKLLAKLMYKNYKVLSSQGIFLENCSPSAQNKVEAELLLVIDFTNKGTLEFDLVKLGSEFDQDCVLLMAKGGQNSTLRGTKIPCEQGSKNKIHARVGCEEIEIQSMKNIEPFLVYEDFIENIGPDTVMGKWALWLATK